MNPYLTNVSHHQILGDGSLQPQRKKQKCEQRNREETSWEETSRSLPEDLFLRIFSLLGAKELLLVGVVCKEWYRLTRDLRLWKQLAIDYQTPLNFFQPQQLSTDKIITAIKQQLLKQRHIKCQILFGKAKSGFIGFTHSKEEIVDSDDDEEWPEVFHFSCSQGNLFVVRTDINKVMAWNIKTKECLLNFIDEAMDENSLVRLEIAGNSIFMLVVDTSQVREFDTAPNNPSHVFEAAPGWKMKNFQVEGNLLITMGENGKETCLTAWNLQTKERCAIFQGNHEFKGNFESFSLKNGLLYVFTSEKQIQTWNCQTGFLRKVVELHEVLPRYSDIQTKNELWGRLEQDLLLTTDTNSENISHLAIINMSRGWELHYEGEGRELTFFRIQDETLSFAFSNGWGEVWDIQEGKSRPLYQGFPLSDEEKNENDSVNITAFQLAGDLLLVEKEEEILHDEEFISTVCIIDRKTGVLLFTVEKLESFVFQNGVLTGVSKNLGLCSWDFTNGRKIS